MSLMRKEFYKRRSELRHQRRSALIASTARHDEFYMSAPLWFLDAHPQVKLPIDNRQRVKNLDRSILHFIPNSYPHPTKTP